MRFDRLNTSNAGWKHLRLPWASLSFTDRPHNRNWINNDCGFFLEELDRFIDQLAIKAGPLIIMGDVNIHIDNTTNADARRLVNYVNAIGMVLHVRELTHG